MALVACSGGEVCFLVVFLNTPLQHALIKSISDDVSTQGVVDVGLHLNCCKQVLCS